MSGWLDLMGGSGHERYGDGRYYDMSEIKHVNNQCPAAAEMIRIK